jgi:ATP-binding cassette, subfamily F, member 3
LQDKTKQSFGGNSSVGLYYILLLKSIKKGTTMLEDILKSLDINEDMCEYILSIFATAKEEEEGVDLDMIGDMLESAGVEDTKPVISRIKEQLGVVDTGPTEVVAAVQLLTTKMSLNSADEDSTLPPPPLPALVNSSAMSASLPSSGSPVIQSTLDDHDEDASNRDHEEWLAEAALQDSLDDTDSFATAWQECVASGNKWGGRGFGGRGVARRYQSGSKGRDVIVDGVTLAFAGKELLTRTALRLVGGRRYALLGRNGVGKSTLLRRIAAGALPGFPPHLTVSYLAQEPRAPLGEAAQQSSLDTLVLGACKKRRVLLEMERDTLEAALAAGSWNTDVAGEENAEVKEEEGEGYDEVVIAERLSEVDDELESISAANGAAQERCYKMLQDLGFSEKHVHAAVGTLSGGWRMRVELAAALIAQADVLLLDEPTNHLDLRGVMWLESRLVEGNTCNLMGSKHHHPTVLVVSHDRAFVSAIATDIILMANETLNYFDGGLDAYEQREAEKATAHEHRMDARVRQETSARESAAKIKAKAQKNGNDNAMRAAKQKLAKVERIGLYRDDGKRFKTNSLAKLDERYILLPSRVEGKVAAKHDVFKFPTPQGATASKDRAIVSLDEVTLARGGVEIIKNVKAFLYPGTRVAIVGDNGAGKTTLLQALVGNLQPASGVRTITPGCKIAFVSQHHADELMKCCEGPTEGAATMLARKFGVSELEARASLGKFGVTGNAALRPMGSLSGGQRVRVSLTSITWNAPDVLLLDEPTNHCDMNALDALATALLEFPGAVAVVSHNRSFLTACCTELWVIEKKKLRIDRPPPDDCTPDAFAKLFSSYASRVLEGGTGGVGSVAGGSSRASKAVSALDSKTKSKRGKAIPGSSASFL